MRLLVYVLSTNNEICEENDSKNDTWRRLGMFCRSDEGEKKKCDFENSSARKSRPLFYVRIQFRIFELHLKPSKCMSGKQILICDWSIFHENNFNNRRSKKRAGGGRGLAMPEILGGYGQLRAARDRSKSHRKFRWLERWLLIPFSVAKQIGVRQALRWDGSPSQDSQN